MPSFMTIGYEYFRGPGFFAAQRKIQIFELAGKTWAKIALLSNGASLIGVMTTWARVNINKDRNRET